MHASLVSCVAGRQSTGQLHLVYLTPHLQGTVTDSDLSLPTSLVWMLGWPYPDLWQAYRAIDQVEVRQNTGVRRGRTPCNNRTSVSSRLGTIQQWRTAPLLIALLTCDLHFHQVAFAKKHAVPCTPKRDKVLELEPRHYM
eukprot:357987-Chlamydomonas_euryale.AAC.1